MASTLHDKRFRCFCGNFDVVRGALILAFVGSFLGSISLISAIVQSIQSGHWELIVWPIISVMSFGLIIFAHYGNKPSYYWPYLIYNGLEIVFLIFSLILLILFCIFWIGSLTEYADPYGYNSRKRRESIKYVRTATIVIMLIISLWIAFKIFTQKIVLQAYQYKKLEQMIKNLTPVV